MKLNNLYVPFPIGTYVVTQEDDKQYIDQVHEYIFNSEGSFVILLLDVEEKPRLSKKIKMEDFLKRWGESERFSNKDFDEITKILYKEEAMARIGELLDNSKENNSCTFK